MKFVCLGYLNLDQFDAQPEEVKTAVMKDCYALIPTFRATGKIVAEEGLQHTRKAKIIRPRKGQPIVTDGPFIETKEQLGSVFIVEADSMEEAIQIASLHPAAQMGEEYGFGIEIRPAQ